jgi:hypothetical protein
LDQSNNPYIVKNVSLAAVSRSRSLIGSFMYVVRKYPLL